MTKVIFCDQGVFFMTMAIFCDHSGGNGGEKNHGTQDSRVVPHRGTNWAALWLTAQIGRDAVLSESYGRGCWVTCRGTQDPFPAAAGRRPAGVSLACPATRVPLGGPPCSPVFSPFPSPLLLCTRPLVSQVRWTCPKVPGACEEVKGREEPDENVEQIFGTRA